MLMQHQQQIITLVRCYHLPILAEVAVEVSLHELDIDIHWKNRIFNAEWIFQEIIRFAYPAKCSLLWLKYDLGGYEPTTYGPRSSKSSGHIDLQYTLVILRCTQLTTCNVKIVFTLVLPNVRLLHLPASMCIALHHQNL